MQLRITEFIDTMLCEMFQSKKRGLSLEEKRDKMLEVFYDSQSFFQVLYFCLVYRSEDLNILQVGNLLESVCTKHDTSSHG